MTNEEKKRKDWQLLTLNAHLTTLARLETVLQNQAIIISELTKIPISSVSAQMKIFEQENYNSTSKRVNETTPDYPKEDRAYK